ncbi:hypothetical protein JW935_16995 [candidate division KSB1 bacterium]|nr:hypothetical protein [candidate division KSB1 bacterium]
MNILRYHHVCFISLLPAAIMCLQQTAENKYLSRIIYIFIFSRPCGRSVYGIRHVLTVLKPYFNLHLIIYDLSGADCHAGRLSVFAGDFVSGSDVYEVLALESESNSRLLKNESFLDWLQGRKEQFMQQFRLAIIDLVRDEIVTKEAYYRGLDQEDMVKRHMEMWQDAYLARYAREQYLKQLKQHPDFDPERMKGQNTFMDEYITTLQRKYTAEIEVDLSVLDGISLMRTDLYTAQPFVPYSQAVPQFPAFIMQDYLNYEQ